MKTQSFLQGTIVFTSLVGLMLAGTLVYKSQKKPRRHGLQETYVKLDPSKVDQIKIIKPSRGDKTDAQFSKKKRTSGRSVSSYKMSTINELFGPFGPLKGLSSRERLQLKKQVVGTVDHKIRRGAISPRDRLRSIEMQVLDKSLEIMEARAE